MALNIKFEKQKQLDIFKYNCLQKIINNKYNITDKR